MPDYPGILNELLDEIRRVSAERDRLTQRISSLKAAIDTVQTLVQQTEETSIPIPQMPPNMEAGFTDRVRSILRTSPFRHFTAVEIRDSLLTDQNAAEAKVLLIHTHNTLKRLLKQEEVTETETEGRTGYTWRLKYAEPDDVMRAYMRRMNQAAKGLSDKDKK
jgi:cell division septum initiation protein DivIVA